MLGVLLAFLASLSWGIAALFSRKGLQYLPPRVSAFIANSTGFFMGTLVGLLFQREAMLSLSISAIGWFALIGILSVGLANYFYYRAIHNVGASRATPIAAASPLLALPMASLLLKEVITLPIAAGAIGVVAGLYLVTSGEGQSGQVKKRGYLFALLAALCWSITALLGRKGVTTFAPALAGIPVTLLFGALLLLPRHGLSQVAQVRRKIWPLLAAGSSSAVGSLCYYSALGLAPVVIVSPLGNMFPLITILGSYLFLRRLERVTIPLAVGTLLTIAGATLITIGRIGN
jgi:drug/metabolite transporter (DMT)-like permease